MYQFYPYLNFYNNNFVAELKLFLVKLGLSDYPSFKAKNDLTFLANYFPSSTPY